MNLHVKCPIFSAKNDEDAKNLLLCSDVWINSQGIVDEAKCGRFHMTLGHAHLWYESITPCGQQLEQSTKTFLHYN